MTHFSTFLRQRMEQLSITRTHLAAHLSTQNKAKAYRHIDAWLSGKQLPNNQQVKVLAAILLVSEDEIVNQIEAAKIYEASQKTLEEQKKRIAAQKEFFPHIGVYQSITTQHLPLPYFTTDNILQDSIPIDDEVLTFSMDQLLHYLKQQIDEYISKKPDIDFTAQSYYYKLNLEFDGKDGICVDSTATIIEEPKPDSEFYNFQPDSMDDDSSGFKTSIIY